MCLISNSKDLKRKKNMGEWAFISQTTFCLTAETATFAISVENGFVMFDVIF